MKINYSHKEIVDLCEGKFLSNDNSAPVHVIYYDTRKITEGEHAIFTSLTTENRDGHIYLKEAYEKGVRSFLVDQNVSLHGFPGATIIQVKNVLKALQTWAKYHRSKFNIPVVGITGSAGKTVVKEWLYHLLSDHFTVARSPKSFNSQLGVALSLFEMNEKSEIALIEAGISEKGEMHVLANLIQPSIGIFTSFSTAHRENFSSEDEHFSEKIALFKSCKLVFAPVTLSQKDFNSLPITFVESADTPESSNLSLVKKVAEHFLIPSESIDAKLKSLPKIAMRMETVEGINGNLLLLDAYNLSFDGLEQALSRQLSLSNQKDRFLVLSIDAYKKFDASSIDSIESRYKLAQLKIEINDIIILGTRNLNTLEEIKGSTILFKGVHPAIKRLASSMKARKHSTFVEISVSALKKNLKVLRAQLPKGVQIMAMVKASSYGAELTKMGDFLKQEQVDYLGVAYVDEGVELRKSGIDLPIMVMNSEKSSWPDCIKYNLEPSVYSFEQLDDLLKELILLDQQNFPIHLKIDTGMHRLGFHPEDMSKVISIVQSQPEIKLKSVYSHLADADNLEDRTYTLEQLNSFQNLSENLQNQIAYPILRHILNSEGVSNYPEFAFDMVRLGIGLYGISSNSAVASKLSPVLSWKSSISQIKTLAIGDSLGYGRTFIAQKTTKIAVIPVGYADGFKRSLSNGKGGVYIHQTYCPTLGRVCMDMIMVDITQSDFNVGDEVEIIGKHQNIQEFAEKSETIPYEIMTSLSPRMPRVFVEDED